MPSHFTNEIDHEKRLLRDSTMLSALNFCFCFLCILSLYRKEKDHVKRIKNRNKRNVYIGNQYYFDFGLPKIRVGKARATEN